MQWMLLIAIAVGGPTETLGAFESAEQCQKAGFRFLKMAAEMEGKTDPLSTDWVFNCKATPRAGKS
ncbi:hypothetical protein [Pseudomonas nitroreducens]|uniref:hypothetical protein n=1 Tax=Pseudomonas nitroreducens TaxID=46680 RepID=UPI00148092A6|nr:hypothetical protein [Pseudomonas nitroreducens]NNN24701.1 hypothetical protein [Pseudomonas nitroreducens]